MGLRSIFLPLDCPMGGGRGASSRGARSGMRLRPIQRRRSASRQKGELARPQRFATKAADKARGLPGCGQGGQATPPEEMGSPFT
jgi:hypothetical protein